MRLTIEFEREEETRWIAEVMELPGVMVYGSTRAEASTRVKALALNRVLDRSEGSHDVYTKGRESLAVPRHSEISAGIVRQWHAKNDRADRREDED